MGVTIDDARAIAATLPRSYEALVRDRAKFRVGRIVYAAFSRDETIMGFGFPRDEREALVASEPDKFLMPRPSDMRYQWVCVRLDADVRGACACPRRWPPPTRVDSCATLIADVSAGEPTSGSSPNWRAPFS